MGIAEDAKWFVLALFRDSQNANCFYGDIKNQTLTQYLRNGSATSGMAVDGVTANWSDYVSSISNGTITFTGKVTRDTGGDSYHTILYSWK